MVNVVSNNFNTKVFSCSFYHEFIMNCQCFSILILGLSTNIFFKYSIAHFLNPISVEPARICGLHIQNLLAVTFTGCNCSRRY